MSKVLIVKEKPSICPKCGSMKIADITYGEPEFSDNSYEKNKLIINGGCMIADNMPHYKCIECSLGFQEYGKSLI